ncbi:hypothetical protein Pmar_PMAR028669 [Perkinsus marinus ATCC 50983]|uniref:Reverse transcriptase domain-containing protein n=1 Tax=Perkinsus marinus (strain ATCC 50983 / TXsc) TaxID=423536 RepID=C5K8J7_PERM5|nr:hypothetical protein Pmar_PMAR028669 [Perkinsus marinus ATCC 50983]EER19204.1 hypothetical protein Pmar_PMAR028669 [Perkinsus marinus ATCC 50983]|eukprot:XP_002787408.1 hypothetical protein Pmar_PMAR028669 [Perkinsus marinus ATCC 50983]
MALTGNPPPDQLLPEERYQYLPNLIILCYYDDIAIALKDERLVKTVWNLLDCIGERLGITFPAEKSSWLSSSTSTTTSHLGLSWFLEADRLRTSFAIPDLNCLDTALDGAVTKRGLLSLCGKCIDPLSLHSERDLLVDSNRSWSGRFGHATDRASWDSELRLNRRDREKLKRLLSNIEELSTQCKHRRWAGYKHIIVTWSQLKCPLFQVQVEGKKSFPNLEKKRLLK